MTALPAVLIPLGAAGVIATLVSGSSKKTITRADLVNPVIGSDLATPLRAESEEDFILNAWDAVGGQIQYEQVGSHLQFNESSDTISCERCQVPKQTMARKKGNCVAKASVLASMLRSQMEADRVYMVIGDLDYNGIGGHAWVEVERNGSWYVLESTKRPGPQPWLLADGARNIYIPYAFFNDQALPYCEGEDLCVAMGCPCLDKRRFVF
ncbi:MAG: transglutaminase domain-containing protein [Patescibacteria group bacterium]